ncbi:unnamed protein product [Echinostoma caproni]|uniref:Reverse transcriptase domain-containing protein n=1 Tax=Echinostoma caproni TaxID=27848 RepID=A0A183A7M2_9TREM|nr:unnamed protein product [Echinostoma caproni]
MAKVKAIEKMERDGIITRVTSSAWDKPIESDVEKTFHSISSHHLRTSSRHLCSNGAAETFAKTVKSTIASASPKTISELEILLDNFLLQYRNAAIATTKSTLDPASSRLFRRAIHDYNILERPQRLATKILKRFIMLVRPPVARNSRNPGRRPLPSRVPMNDLNRPLLRQFVRNRRSDPRYEAYILEVREGPAVNGNTNAAAGKSMPQPWVTVRDSGSGNQSIGLPVSICDTLLKHLLTCVVSDDSGPTDQPTGLESPHEPPSSPDEAPATSPARASGDAKSPADEANSEEASLPKTSPTRITQRKQFQLSRLSPVRIVCETTGCILEIISRDPNAKRSSGTGEDAEPVAPVTDPSLRWIVSIPVKETNGEQSSESKTTANTSTTSKRRHPWETRGSIELHETLMAQLCAFLADVVTRYLSVNPVPEVRSLYSASGGRRFFFDLRDTRWGKRLHISQVTDLHRNVIGIPLETLVSFRARIDAVIQGLKLEDQHTLRSEIYPSLGDRVGARNLPRGTGSPHGRSDEAGESADNASGGRKSASLSAHRPEGSGGPSRLRGRRRQRVGNFSGNGPPAAASAPGASNSRSADAGEHVSDVGGARRGPQGANSAGGGGMAGPGRPGQWGPGARVRRFGRRARNPRPMNNNTAKPRRGSGTGEAEASETAASEVPVQNEREKVLDSAHVAPVAEASA